MGTMTFLFISILCFQYAWSQQLTGPVSTEYGYVQGITTTSEDGTNNVYSRFLGVPFAKPPLGSLRFRPPQRPDNWDGILNTTEFSKVCPQFPLRDGLDPIEDMGEDCLYLNVFVPGDFVDNRTDLLPVMLFIHGGLLMVGEGRIHDSSILVTRGEPVVAVVIQYRLNIFGFFSTGDDRIPGNAGLRDQTFAMQWVRDNIAHFGGDKDQVTIFGGSSGAQSVVLHLVSPLSAGLFQRAIVESLPGVLRYPMLDRFQGRYEATAVSKLGCEPDSDIVECYQNASINELLPDSISWVVIDGEFLIENPYDSIANGRVNAATIVLGYNNDDGDAFATILGRLYPDWLISGIPKSNILAMDIIFRGALSILISDELHIFNILTGMVPIERDGRPVTNLHPLLALLMNKYTHPDQITNARLILDAFRDSVFVTGTLWVAEQIAKNGGDVFVYSFEHRSLNRDPQDPDAVQVYAPHAEELFYVLGAAVAYERFVNYTVEEATLSISMINAWTTFATTGQPVFLTMDGIAINWPQYESPSPQFVVFDISMTNESVEDLGTHWQPIADFWTTVVELAVFEPVMMDTTISPDSSEESQEFESEVLKMDEFQADVAVILLASACFLLLVTTIILACYVCKKLSSSSRYAI